MFQIACLLRSSVAAFAIAAVLPSAPAIAADLGPGADDRAPAGAGRLPPPWLDRSFDRGWADEGCRVVTRRRVNAFGEEIIRRARICEEGPIADRVLGRPTPHDLTSDDPLRSGEFVPPADVPDEEGELR